MCIPLCIPKHRTAKGLYNHLSGNGTDADTHADTDAYTHTDTDADEDADAGCL